MDSVDENHELAVSLDVDVEVLPLLPELLEDLEALGSWPETVVDHLRPLALPPGTTRVLDLACGKGAVALRIAEELGFEVYGVDLVDAFLEHARNRARVRGLTRLCHFAQGDIRDALAHERGYDVVIHAALGGLLGDASQTMRALRSTVRAHRYIVVDDGYLANPERLARPGYEHYRSLEETRRGLTAHGDVIVREYVPPSELVRAHHAADLATLARTAESVARRHPADAALIARFLARQREDYATLEEEFVSALWLLQKDGPEPAAT